MVSPAFAPRIEGFVSGVFDRSVCGLVASDQDSMRDRSAGCQTYDQYKWLGATCGGDDDGHNSGQVSRTNFQDVNPAPDDCVDCADQGKSQGSCASPYSTDSCGWNECTGTPQDYSAFWHMGTDEYGNTVRCEDKCLQEGWCCDVTQWNWTDAPTCRWTGHMVGQNSPLIVDVFNLGEPDLLVPGTWKKDRRYSGSLMTVRRFNLDGTKKLDWEWVGPKAGLLVYGQTLPTEVDGTKLFGNVTFGKSWSQGYEPLATLDTNKDDKLDGDELKVLWIWLDANSDAEVQEGEIRPAADYLTKIPLHYETDAAGNTWQDPSILLKDGRAVRSWDWWSRRPENLLQFQGTVYQGAGGDWVRPASAFSFCLFLA